ncbi:hypothetical protein J43TS3_00060 [Ornithinibacillus bavariensis]|uniref:Uncharacterized protein n=1 Tax=Ornithinibacillus bavariensis TaxID=545502 RepID=A0A919X6E1_9BACI|nr:hypothetical protein J43TS3_00060 [Ornithinibacillus bavariensis]
MYLLRTSLDLEISSDKTKLLIVSLETLEKSTSHKLVSIIDVVESYYIKNNCLSEIFLTVWIRNLITYLKKTSFVLNDVIRLLRLHL